MDMEQVSNPAPRAFVCARHSVRAFSHLRTPLCAPFAPTACATHFALLCPRCALTPSVVDIDTAATSVKVIRIKPSTRASRNGIVPFDGIDQEDAVDQEVNALCKGILGHRITMNASAPRTHLFDQQWAIDSTLDLPNLHASALDRLAFASDALRTYHKDLTATAAALAGKAELFPLYSPAHAGLELMHLFMIDLLGRTTSSAIIFRNKFNEDFESLEVISWIRKYLSIALVLGLNGFFIYFTLLKGVSRGMGWQYTFLQTVLVQFAIDVALFETIECLWLHYVVPESVRHDVYRAVNVLQTIADEAAVWKADEESTSARPSTAAAAKGAGAEEFNAPQYFFVSHSLAEMRPKLLESQIVLNYRNAFPGMICQTWPHAKAHHAHEHKGFSSNVSRRAAEAYQQGSFLFSIVLGLASGIVYSLQSLGVLPVAVQRMLVRSMQTTVLSGLTLLYYTAIKNVLYFLAFVAVVLGVVGFFVLRYFYKHKQDDSSMEPEDKMTGEPAGEPVGEQGQEQGGQLIGQPGQERQQEQGQEQGEHEQERAARAAALELEESSLFRSMDMDTLAPPSPPVRVSQKYSQREAMPGNASSGEISMIGDVVVSGESEKSAAFPSLPVVSVKE